MKVLLIGSGGREHALACKLRSSPLVSRLWCVPGNAGIAVENGIEIAAGDIVSPPAMAALARSLQADLTVVGPEAPLVAGIVDEFLAHKLAIVGPTQAAARLEGSKIFAKQFME